MAEKTKIGAGGVLEALRQGPFREPAHAWLYEVRNGTGYKRQERYADGLVVSLWPSRGIWFAGIEVKVDRQDWKHELDDPTKSAEIQRFCDFWYLATPDGIVKPGELPEKWGHYIVSADGKKASLAKEAPRLETQPLSRDFVASVLRNASVGQKSARQAGRDEVWREFQEKHGASAVAELEKKLYDAEHQLRMAEAKENHVRSELDAVRRTIAEFEQETGASVGIGSQRGWQAGKRIGAQWKLAEKLAQINPHDLAESLRKIVEELETLPPNPLEARG